MSHQRVQSARVALLIGLIIIALFVGLIVVIIYIARVVLERLSGQWAEVDPTVMAALIAGAVTILSSVLIASYNSRRAQERAAEEANRGRKVEIYNDFIKSLTQMLIQHKSDKGIDLEKTAEFFTTFSYQLMVYGGPGVIRVYSDWRAAGEKASEGTPEMLTLVDKLLRAMRDDIGVSNKGIKENELLGLVIIGGKSEIDKSLKKD